MTGPHDRRPAWSLSRADLEAGAGALPRLLHPLLPDFLAALPGAGAVCLLPGPAVPSALPESLPAGHAVPFLARLCGLCAFLRSASLGIDPADVGRVGHVPRSPQRPALAAPPVPEFRAAPPGLVVAALAARLAGQDPPEATDRYALRAYVTRALEAGLPEPYGRIVASALRSADASERSEALLWRILPEPSPDVTADLLGFVLPAPRVPAAAAGAPCYAAGPAAHFLARGAARLWSGATAWVEIQPGEALVEGAAFERAVALLGDDARALLLRSALLDGARASEPPPVVLVGREVDRWDPASRAAWDRLAAVPNVSRVETRLRRPAPWEAGVELTHPAGLAEVSASVWLPFASLTEAVGGWESITRACGGDFSAVPELACGLARTLRPGRPALPPPRRRPAPGTGAILDAAALLPSGFDAAEVARASGRGRDESAEALSAALSAGLLSRYGEQSFEFADEGERRDRARRLSAGSRRDVVARLSRPPAGSPRRLVVTALARGLSEDVRAAGRELRRAEAEGELPLAVELIRHAPASSPDLGEPLAAARALLRAGSLEDARRILGRAAAGPGVLQPEVRREAAGLLARLGDTGAALRLLAGDDSVEGALWRAEVLVEGRRDAEARSLLSRAPLDEPRALARRDLPRLRLLRAELAARALDTDAAATLLSELAGDLAEGALDRRLAARVAFSSGYLASDLGRPGEAKVFFRRAFEESDDPRSRADARLDLAVVHLHEGALNEAASTLSEALCFYEAAGEEGRYVSALGNRVEIALAAGRYADAREDLERVLAFDRRPGRDRQLLYDIPAWQRLALLEGDLAEAARAFEEAKGKVSSHPDHEAYRDALVLEGQRRLLAGDPEGCVRVLEEAGRRPDNRMCNEPLRVRLLRSARIDLGEAEGPPTRSLGEPEETLLGAEARLRRDGLVPVGARRLLERRLHEAPGQVASRLVEWAIRFPAAFEGERGAPLSELGLRAAGLAGLTSARAFFLRAPAAPLAPARDAGRPGGRPELVVADAATRSALEDAAKVAGTNVSVLILGETGTGKEALAREIHRLSGRTGRFVPVNVAALTETLLESELFGHARGAFTGADRDRVGLVEESSGGTLFLDEIGEMAQPLQAKLLRVLQEREVRRLGETRERKVDLRVVAATHRDLAARMKGGSFREDLYFRLAGLEVRLPPLRERPRDLVLLLERALSGRAALTARARSRLLSHPWPGNVRELLSAVEAAVALAAPGRTIDVGHLPPGVRGEEPVQEPRGGRGRYFDGVDDARRRIIGTALSEAHGNRTAAARLLGLSRQSLLYEMNKLGLSAPRGEARVTTRSRPGRIGRP